MRIHAIILLVGTAIALAGCNTEINQPKSQAATKRPNANKPLAEKVGEPCIIFFRHDALGIAKDIPSSYNAGNVNGADVAVDGELLAVSEKWIVIRGRRAVGNRIMEDDHYIPREVILHVKFDVPQEEAEAEVTTSSAEETTGEAGGPPPASP